jgi:rubrerythrin
MREKIIEFVNTKYKGSLRFLKSKMFIEALGLSIYNTVIENTSFLQNDEPLSQRVYCFLNDITNLPICNICGKTVKYNSNNGYQKYCSNQCRIKGMPLTHHKVKMTNIEKYGSSNFFSSDAGKKKIKETNLKKYGVENYTQTDEYKKRLKMGDIQKTPNTQKVIQTYRSKNYDLLKDKYSSIEPLFTKDQYQGAASYDVLYNWKCKECHTVFERWLNNNYPLECPSCKPKGTFYENYFKNFFKSLGITYIYRDRTQIPGFELDFYLPEHRLGIEINGLYWHCEKNIPEKKYHLKKTEEAIKNDIRLIQIFEDELYDKMPIVISRIKHALKIKKRSIYARNCEVFEINVDRKRKFLSKYHIQGDVHSKYNLGLFYKKHLVAVMCFQTLRIVTGNSPKEKNYELTRYCSLKNFNIIGGASKLLSFFVKNNKPKSILSYADRRWSDGNVYEKIGFKFLKFTPINYWYTKNYKKREHRFQFQKHLLKNKFKNFDPGLTEYENMKNNGYTRIWDCGHIKYVLDI